MSSQRRATVYFDPDLHKVLRLKAAETDRSLSDLVNDAVRSSLSEDAGDLAAITERSQEPRLPFADLAQDLRRRGKL